jgi:uncharacterized protein YdhG (YjbR/CyaY superfamily)
MKKLPKVTRKKQKPPRFKTVAEYLASLDPVKRSTVKSVIDLILAEFPGLESKISWNVPTIHRNGKYVAGICAFQHHLTFAPWSPRVIKDFKARLARYVVGQSSFQFPVDWKVDKRLVKALVRARLAELDSPPSR